MMSLQCDRNIMTDEEWACARHNDNVERIADVITKLYGLNSIPLGNGVGGDANSMAGCRWLAAMAVKDGLLTNGGRPMVNSNGMGSRDKCRELCTSRLPDGSDVYNSAFTVMLYIEYLISCTCVVEWTYKMNEILNRREERPLKVFEEVGLRRMVDNRNKFIRVKWSMMYDGSLYNRMVIVI